MFVSPAVRRQMREADQLPPNSKEDKNAWSYISVS
jgi:hypothetical protein